MLPTSTTSFRIVVVASRISNWVFASLAAFGARTRQARTGFTVVTFGRAGFLPAASFVGSVFEPFQATLGGHTTAGGRCRRSTCSGGCLFFLESLKRRFHSLLGPGNHVGGQANLRFLSSLLDRLDCRRVTGLWNSRLEIDDRLGILTSLLAFLASRLRCIGLLSPTDDTNTATGITTTWLEIILPGISRSSRNRFICRLGNYFGGQNDRLNHRTRSFNDLLLDLYNSSNGRRGFLRSFDLRLFLSTGNRRWSTYDFGASRNLANRSRRRHGTLGSRDYLSSGSFGSRRRGSGGKMLLNFGDFFVAQTGQRAPFIGNPNTRTEVGKFLAVHSEVFRK